MNEEERRETEIKQIPTEDILPDPRKPLGKYTWRELAKLALKIKICFGAPLPVAPAPASDMYILLSDDKKLRAALLLGLNSVPCEIIERSVINRHKCSLNDPRFLFNSIDRLVDTSKRAGIDANSEYKCVDGITELVITVKTEKTP